MNMNLPESFLTTIRNAFKEDAEPYLTALRFLIEEACQRWGLTEVQPVGNLSYNFVAFAKCPYPSGTMSTSLPVGRSAQDGVVLKIGVPRDELISEINALKLYAGQGAVRLLDADEDKGMFLLERLQPGRMLSEIEDDIRATEIAADVMLKIRRPLSLESDSLLSDMQKPALQSKFINLSDWFKAFERLRAQFNGGTGPFDKKLFETAEAIAKDFFAEAYPPTLMHGDFHHYNILEAERGWLIIDPKGVIGPAEYEVGPLLINPLGRPLSRTNPKVQMEKRFAILAERLSVERERIRKWGVAHAVLSACWNLEDGEDWTYAIRCAELMS
jgi:streptomycin 6-kinase